MADRPQSNSTPDSLVAVLTHALVRERDRVKLAMAGAERAECAIVDAGLDLPAIERTLALIAADPSDLEREQRQTASILMALRAPVEVEQVEVISRTSDEPEERYLERVRRAGYFAAVLNRACDGGGHADGSRENRAWVAGFADFRADLKAHEQQQRLRVRRAA